MDILQTTLFVLTRCVRQTPNARSASGFKDRHARSLLVALGQAMPAALTVVPMLAYILFSIVHA